MTKQNTITVTVNGVTFEGLSFEQAQAISGLVVDNIAKPETKETKGEKSTETKKTKGKSDKPQELTKQTQGMINRAIERAKAHGFDLGYYVQGTWVWFYDKSASEVYGDKGYTRNKTPEFLALGSDIDPKTKKTKEKGKIATKAAIVERSKKRGQLVIKHL